MHRFLALHISYIAYKIIQKEKFQLNKKQKYLLYFIILVFLNEQKKKLYYFKKRIA